MSEWQRSINWLLRGPEVKHVATFKDWEVCEDVRRKLENHDAMLAALTMIADVGDGWGGKGTTGEGHAWCREIACAALEDTKRRVG